MCLLPRTRHPGRFHRGSRRVDQDNSNGSCNHVENSTSFANLGNSFGHTTRTLPLSILHEKVTVAGNRLPLNLSINP